MGHPIVSHPFPEPESTILFPPIPPFLGPSIERQRQINCAIASGIAVETPPPPPRVPDPWRDGCRSWLPAYFELSCGFTASRPLSGCQVLSCITLVRNFNLMSLQTFGQVRFRQMVVTSLLTSCCPVPLQCRTTTTILTKAVMDLVLGLPNPHACLIRPISESSDTQTGVRDDSTIGKIYHPSPPPATCLSLSFILCHSFSCHRGMPISYLSLSTHCSPFILPLVKQTVPAFNSIVILNQPATCLHRINPNNHRSSNQYRQHVHQNHREICGLPLHLLQSCRRPMPGLWTPWSRCQDPRSPSGLHLFAPFGDQLTTIILSTSLSGLGLWERKHHPELPGLLPPVTNANQPDGGSGRPGTTLLSTWRSEGRKDGSMRRGYRQASLGPRALCLRLGPGILPLTNRSFVLSSDSINFLHMKSR